MSGYNNGGGGYRGGRGGYGGGTYNQRGGYNQGYNQGYDGGRKRGRDEDYSNDSNQRRRYEGNFQQQQPQYGGRQGGRSYQQQFQPPPPVASSSTRFKEELYAMGDPNPLAPAGTEQPEYDPVTVIPYMADYVTRQYSQDATVVLEAFRVAATEIPHKLAHYATLVAYLSGDPVATAVIEDLGVAFSQFVHEGRWRAARTTLLFLTEVSLVVPALLPVEQLEPYLQSYIAILNEPDVKAAQGDNAVRTLVEVVLKGGAGALVQEIKDKAQTYLAARKVEGELFATPSWEDKLEWLVSTLASDTPLTTAGPLLPSPFATLPAHPEQSEVVAVTLPPLDRSPPSVRSLPTRSHSAGLLTTEGIALPLPVLQPRFFDDETVPGLYEPEGVLLRSLVEDIIEGWEVNRKEGARILLDLRRWCKEGTFRPSGPAAQGEDLGEGSQWILENVVVESILTTLFSLPAPPLPRSYYHSLLCELCRLSPTTVAPALGKSVRKLFTALGESDDLTGGPEGVRRFAEWWSAHLSNFNFLWSWADWAPDMDLGASHPKRVFVERTIALEVRLSYWDRVRGTIPTELFETGVMASEAPGPNFEYDAPEHEHYAAAQSLLRLIKQKGHTEEVVDELNAFAKALESEGKSEEAAEDVKRDMAVQTILSVGSRSFSHFLNVLERYLPLLRSLSSSSSARIALLRTLQTFWVNNSHFHLIALDKLLQYRLVDPADVVAWLFDDDKRGWTGFDKWEIVRKVFGLVVGRWNATGRKVGEAKVDAEVPKVEHIIGGENGAKEEREEGAEEEPKKDGEDVVIPDGPAQTELELAEEQQQITLTELAATISSVIAHFNTLLAAPSSDDEWARWWTEGWFREFARMMVSQKVVSLSVVAEAVEGLEARA